MWPSMTVTATSSSGQSFSTFFKSPASPAAAARVAWIAASCRRELHGSSECFIPRFGSRASERLFHPPPSVMWMKFWSVDCSNGGVCKATVAIQKRHPPRHRPQVWWYAPPRLDQSDYRDVIAQGLVAPHGGLQERHHRHG